MFRALCLALVLTGVMSPLHAEDPVKTPGNPTPPSFPAPPNLPPGLSAPTQAQDTCGAQALQGLVGYALPDPFPASGPLRVFSTGDALTLDFRQDRLNVELHPESRLIVAITCG